jgi:hypothetical protein
MSPRYDQIFLISIRICLQIRQCFIFETFAKFIFSEKHEIGAYFESFKCFVIYLNLCKITWKLSYNYVHVHDKLFVSFWSNICNGEGIFSIDKFERKKCPFLWNFKISFHAKNFCSFMQFYTVSLLVSVSGVMNGN